MQGLLSGSPLPRTVPELRGHQTLARTVQGKNLNFNEKKEVEWDGAWVVELLMAKGHACPQRVSDAQRPRVGKTNHEL